ncbi:collagen alpha-1(I) chain-like [Falco rusticolus]|uniref:collagen alpha-1(I) chain-like n=1 Tax=Falco rusticolus TaxID=120794 RepID=UPI001886713C|nr:collagen alpha-1(I) chain-like [Falco rusticolus]XP_037239488.1 collagen alpha-1(I) chain-like [Falco rusticolus]
MPRCTGSKGGTQGPPALLGGDSDWDDTGKRQSTCACCLAPNPPCGGPGPQRRGLSHLPTSMAPCPLPSWPECCPSKAQLPAGPAWQGAVLLREDAGLQCLRLRNRWGFVSQSVPAPLPLLPRGCAVRALHPYLRGRGPPDRGGLVDRLLLEGQSPPQSRGAAQWCHIPAPGGDVRASGSCPSGLWCYRGDISAVDGGLATASTQTALPPPGEHRGGPGPRVAGEMRPLGAPSHACPQSSPGGAGRAGAQGAGRCLSLPPLDGTGRAARSSWGPVSAPGALSRLITGRERAPGRGQAGTGTDPRARGCPAPPCLAAAANRGRAGHRGLLPTPPPPRVSSPKHPLCCFAKPLKYSWRCAERLLMNF